MRSRPGPWLGGLRHLVALILIGLLLALAVSLLGGQEQLAERLGTAIYELFAVLAVVVALECWILRQDGRKPQKTAEVVDPVISEVQKDLRPSRSDG